MLKILLIVVLGYFGIVTVLTMFQRKLIYYPEMSAPLNKSAGLSDFDRVILETNDGLKLQAFYTVAKKADAPTLVYFHGNGSFPTPFNYVVKPYLDAGYGVLLVIYRGYSSNPGKPSEKGLYADARAGISYLKEKGVSSEQLVLYGESIGAAVAIQMATEHKVSALVLIAPFTALADVAAYHYPIIPVHWFLRDRFNSIKKIKKLHVPLLVLHGDNDTIVPIQFGQRLFHEANKPKQFLVLPKTGHNDVYRYPISQYVIAYLSSGKSQENKKTKPIIR